MTQKQLIAFAFAAAGYNVGILILNIADGNTGMAIINAASALIAGGVGIAVIRR